MTALDLDDIEAKARAVSPKPRYPRDPNGPALQCPKCGGPHISCTTEQERRARNEFIAASNPQTVLALVARIREMGEALKPFGELFAQHDVRWPEDADDCAMFQIGTARLEAGDLRRAARVLADPSVLEIGGPGNG